MEPGSTKDGIQLVRDFLGEEPDDKYFLIAKGLSSQWCIYNITSYI